MTNTDIAPADFDLTCWYMNQRRVIELLDTDAIAMRLQPWGHLPSDHAIRRSAEIAILKNALQALLRQANIPTLGQLLTSGTHLQNELFTYYTNFYFRAVKETPAFAYAKLDDFVSGLKLETRFHIDHFTSQSSFSELSGQKTLFVLGLVTDVVDKTIQAIPYVIANPLPQLGQKATMIGRRWGTRFELYPEELDCFSRIAQRPSPNKARALRVLSSIPESEIKSAFAEIIGESSVTKDWGGETCDLISHLVTVDGERMPTAFLLKGPASFSPMKATHLGKNGDQIVRLFSEEAELFVLQHCHDVTSPVRAQMRAFAQQISRLKFFSIIDGHSTYRILSAYEKCGITAEVT
jgi:hypothetical protein